MAAAAELELERLPVAEAAAVVEAAAEAAEAVEVAVGVAVGVAATGHSRPLARLSSQPRPVPVAKVLNLEIQRAVSVQNLRPMAAALVAVKRVA